MTREQYIAKAENIIHAALHQIEQAAENAAYMSGHAIRFGSCYTIQELDAMQKKCNAEQIKSDTLSAIYHDMRNNCESVKVLDFAVIYLWYPRIRTAAIRHATAHMKRTGEALDFFTLYDWIYDRIPAEFWKNAAEIRSAYKSAFVTLTVKKGA